VALVLHEHPFASYCQKVLIALYELELPFERVLVEGREEHVKLWPLNTIPVLLDTDAGLTLPESTTIVEHVDRVAGAGRLIPSDPAAALQARLWDRIADNHIAGPMQKIVGDSLRPEGRTDPEGVAQARAQLDTAYGVLDDQLRDRDWLAGDAFTVADCAAAPALLYCRAVHRWDADASPAVTRYVRALLGRPSVARVIDEARPYREIFPLPWPDDFDELGPGSAGGRHSARNSRRLSR
jgi:glutathione S-transferase